MGISVIWLLMFWCIGHLWQLNYAIVIVHNLHESETSQSTLNTLTINISREVIVNEVTHGLQTVSSEILHVKDQYKKLLNRLSQESAKRREDHKQLLEEIKQKEYVIGIITDKLMQLDSETRVIKRELVRLYKEVLEGKHREYSKRGVPQWYRKVRQERIQEKVNNFLKGFGDMRNAFDKDEDIWKNDGDIFCQKFKEHEVRTGVPQWVVEVRQKRYLKECGENPNSENVESNVYVDFNPPQFGYGQDDNYEEETIDDDTELLESNASRKSQKRKIDEVFLKLMMRSQRMSWTDLNLIKENMALFMEHVSGTAKLCSRVMVHPDRKHFEACKERIGMNFAMSLAVALTTTVVMVTSVFVSALVIFRLKVSLTLMWKRMNWDALSPRRLLGTFKMSKTPKHIQALMHHMTNPDLCVLVWGEESMDQCKRLVERLLASSGVQASTLFHCLASMADFQLLPVSRAYLVMVDISTLEGGRIFEEATGQNNVLFKVSEELMSQNAQVFLVCIHDADSKQLPRGNLYNKNLVSKHDNYVLRSYCRAHRFVTSNQEFTATQTAQLEEWIKHAIQKQ